MVVVVVASYSSKGNGEGISLFLCLSLFSLKSLASRKQRISLRSGRGQLGIHFFKWCVLETFEATGNLLVSGWLKLPERWETGAKYACNSSDPSLHLPAACRD